MFSVGPVDEFVANLPISVDSPLRHFLVLSVKNGLEMLK